MKRDFTPDLSALKEELRRDLRRQLREMNSSFQAEASLVICELAARLPAFRAGTCIGLFAPLASEPDIHPLIEEAWAERKTVALPRLGEEGTSPRLQWHAVTRWSEVTEPGPFGLREPDPAQCALLDPSRIDCLFAPGLAFDRDGMRLGRGGGFYDRVLAELSNKVPRLGLMFQLQQVASLPREPHDQALPAIVTEEGVLTFGVSAAGGEVRSIQPPPTTSSPR